MYEIIASIRKLNSKAYIVWGGIHPIIHPEDAIKHADAVCTGEGEFAFKNFLELFRSGKDYTTAPSFWFRKNNSTIKNKNLPVCSALSGNRNFEGRISPHIKANYLASPPLVVAYALAGHMEVDLYKDALGKDKDGNDIYLKDIWPSNKEIEDT